MFSLRKQDCVFPTALAHASGDDFGGHRTPCVVHSGSAPRDEAKLRESLSAFEHGNHPPLLNRAVLVKHSGFEMI